MVRDRRLSKSGSTPARRNGADEFWSDIGVDIESMSPQAQAITGVVAGGLILLAAGLLIAFTNYWWLIFVFGWAVFPAFGVFARGVAGLTESHQHVLPGNSKERELLGALREHGEVSSMRVAMETSLSVEEADKILEELAAKGHLEVRVSGGGLVYSPVGMDQGLRS